MKEFYIKYVETNFGGSTAKDILDAIDWDEWIFGKGMPPVKMNFMNKDVTDAQNLAMAYIKEKG